MKALYRKRELAEAALQLEHCLCGQHVSETQQLHHTHAQLRYVQDVWTNMCPFWTLTRPRYFTVIINT